jgi:hypothetical protein
MVKDKNMRPSTKKTVSPEFTVDLHITPQSGDPIHAFIEEKQSDSADGRTLKIIFHVTEKDFSGFRLSVLPASFEAQVNVCLPV